MRVLQVVHRFTPHSIGGTEVYTDTLAKELSHRGHRVSVFCRRDVHQGQHGDLVRAERERLKVYEVLCRRDKFNPLSLFFSTFVNRFVEDAFAKVLSQEKPHLVHFQHLTDLSTNLLRMAHQRGLPTVWTIHDYWATCANCQLVTPGRESCDGPRLWINCAHCGSSVLSAPGLKALAPLIAPLFAYRALKTRQASEAADLMIFPSSCVREFFAGSRMADGRSRTVVPGINTAGMVPHRSEKSVPGLHLAYLGSIAWQKGVHVLVEALQTIHPDRVRLSIHGDHSGFPAYTEQLRAAAGKARITFDGPFRRDQLWGLLADVDLVVVPSLWPETSCLVAQEALAAGVPVIASRIGALPERVQDGTNGLLFPANDSLALSQIVARLLEVPSLLESLRRGIRPVRSIQQHADEMEVIYREITGGPQ